MKTKESSVPEGKFTSIINFNHITQTHSKEINLSCFPDKIKTCINLTGNQILLGPHRIIPGRLSVSRSFGDIEAKTYRLGGLPNVLIATPEIFAFKIDDTIDFIVLGCKLI